MASGSRDPYTVEAVLVGEDEYQAPPREEGQPQTNGEGDVALRRPDDQGRPDDQASEQPIDINLLESQQQKPGLQTSETIVVDPSEKKEFTVSGPDEETQPGGPRTVPPGESM